MGNARFTALLLLLGSMFVAGCRNEAAGPGFRPPAVAGPDELPPGETAAPTPEPPPFTITPSRMRLTVVPGGESELTVQVQRHQPAVGAITVSVGNLPAGVESSELILAIEATSGTITLAAAPDAAPRGTDATIFASASTFSARHPLGVRIWIPGSRGIVDESFGESGYFRFPHGLYDVVELPDGRLLVGGSGSHALCRFESSGSVDESFGIGGCQAALPGIERVNRLHVVEDAVIAAGLAQTAAGGYQLVVGRASLDGAPDATFGSDGWVQFDLPVFQDARIAGLPDGGILLFLNRGHQTTAGYLLQLKSDGSPDPAFGSNGLIVFNTFLDGRVLDMARTSDGRLYVTTTRGVRAYSAGGERDMSFGETEGVAPFDDGRLALRDGYGVIVGHRSMGMTHLSPTGATIADFQPTNTWLQFARTADFSTDFDEHGIFVLRYGEQTAIASRSLNGGIDTDFGDGAIVELPFRGEFQGVTILRDGRILARGVKYGSQEGEEPYRPTTWFLLRIQN